MTRTELARAANVAQPIIRDAKIETWEDHIEAWHHFGRVANGAMWGRAEVAASVESEFGEASIAKFAIEVRQAPSWVARLRQVHAAFPDFSTRVETLSFLHHFVAMSATDPAAALAKAEAEGWSARQLRVWINESKSLRPAEPFHILVATGDFREAVESLVRKEAEHWPSASRPVIPDLLRSLASDFEEEFRAD